MDFAFQHSITSGVAGLPAARASLRRWLEDRDVRPEIVSDSLLALGEAVSNAIEHSGTEPSKSIEITAKLNDGELAMLVADGGRWREFPGRRDGGHGLSIMRILMDEVTIETGESGSRVRLRKHVDVSPVGGSG